MSETDEESSDFAPSSTEYGSTGSEFEDEDSSSSPPLDRRRIDSDDNEFFLDGSGSETEGFSMESDSEVMLPLRRRQQLLAMSDAEDSETELLSTTDDNNSSVADGAHEVVERDDIAGTADDVVTIAIEGDEDLLSVAESTTAMNESPSASPESSTSKRKHSSSSTQPSPKRTKDKSSDEEETNTCPICFEPWSNSGKHRLASLKCGHLFGQSCVERWVKQASKCPQCNTKARKADIRILYAKKLNAIDTTELVETTTSLERERKLRREKEMELAQVRMQYQIKLEECKRLKEIHEVLKNNQTVSSVQSAATNETLQASSKSSFKKFQIFKNIVISQPGNCRVMDYDDRLQCIAISQPSPHTNFMPGFGIKKFSAADMKSSQFTIMHSKAIKDVKYCPAGNGLLLTASQDSTLKITSMNSNAVVQTYRPGRPVWSCCWDQKNFNLLYAGMSNGEMYCYDTRNTSEAICTKSNPTSRCPIVSMFHIPHHLEPCIHGGLLVQTLEGVTFWQNGGDPCSPSEFKPNILPLQPGSCAGLQYVDEWKQCLVTYRPGRSYNRTTHLLCKLDIREYENRLSSTEGAVSFQLLQTLHGGLSHKMLTRNAMFTTRSKENIICVGDEAKNAVNIYNECSSSGQFIFSQSLHCNSPALDILPLEINDRRLLAALTDCELKIFEMTK